MKEEDLSNNVTPIIKNPQVKEISELNAPNTEDKAIKHNPEEKNESHHEMLSNFNRLSQPGDQSQYPPSSDGQSFFNVKINTNINFFNMKSLPHPVPLGFGNQLPGMENKVFGQTFIFNQHKVEGQSIPVYPLNTINQNTKKVFQSGESFQTQGEMLPQNFFNCRALKNIKPIQVQGLNYSEMGKEQLAQYLPFLAKDQGGCRFLQKRISEDFSFSNDFLFFELYPNLLEYMYDAFGNYLIQKLLESISDDKIKEVLFLVSSQFVNLGESPHGTRVLQKIIEVIKDKEDLTLIFTNIFQKYSMHLIRDINGNHIIIKFVTSFKSPENDFIYGQIQDNIADICTDKHGCCVVQKCIENGTSGQKVNLDNKEKTHRCDH